MFLVKFYFIFMKNTNQLPLAKMGEDLAASLLLKKNYEILQMNFHSRFGEIDIVSKLHNHIIFVEVKTRCNLDRDIALETVTPKKQRRIIKTAQHYLQRHQEYNDFMIQFDIVLIFYHPDSDDFSYEHIEDAFSTSWI
jgi:putative endonuclease